MFEWDKVKNRKNYEKHGISFEDGIFLWLDPKHVIGKATTVDNEIRYFIVGNIENVIWVCIYTIRGENRRMISIRRARKKEKDLYEKN